eukprot:Em0015g853a
MIIDEGHRLKNSSSVLYGILKQIKVPFHLLLTGTPVQNNLSECAANLCTQFSNIKDEGVASMLHFVLQPFLLRRVKSEVLLDLPEKSEVILYTGLSAVQKKLYKAILTKDVSAFGESGSKTRLMNVLVQLRKCVNHPYLFDGVEPEPFEAGEHLIEASGKLFIIDKLLAHLKSRGHRVLMFSQMTRMLDVIQDYRGYTYERLDGSVRGEERFLAVKNFSNDPESFVFLLSTRAGGQGLNLVGADTIIFVDSDFNPQNDLQAAARAHRIGQIRPVKVIRLLGKNTVEKVILKRAYAKLELTATVIEGGQFSHGTTGGIAVGQPLVVVVGYVPGTIVFHRRHRSPSFPKRHSIAGDLVFVFDDPRAATPHSIVAKTKEAQENGILASLRHILCQKQEKSICLSDREKSTFIRQLQISPYVFEADREGATSHTTQFDNTSTDARRSVYGRAMLW